MKEDQWESAQAIMEHGEVVRNTVDCYLQIKGTDKKPEVLSGLIAKVDKSNVYQSS